MMWKSHELDTVLSWNQTFSGSGQRGRQCRIITVGVPFSALITSHHFRGHSYGVSSLLDAGTDTNFISQQAQNRAQPISLEDAGA